MRDHGLQLLCDCVDDMAAGDDLLEGDVDEEDTEYLYNDWGVDYVDLDFKTGITITIG